MTPRSMILLPLAAVFATSAVAQPVAEGGRKYSTELTGEAEGETRLRPDSYTVCATEATVTRCTGGGTSHATATPVVVESDATTRVALTLP